ncbi:hypothetical protein R4227_21920 [Gordonia amicalis]|uniref:hypothetical protein n=1 Tax=Gordonia amicalis TaxID=89053 RepID=UPI002954FA9E|nr:hypothetical protein [Gordonia amicalis]MDV7102681.1 hypothetical protein [Gordonia amicalis]
MSTPFSDDSLLPKPAPAMPVSPHGGEYLLRSERALWERRAAVASDVSSQLIEAIEKLRDAARYNHFGKCNEGEDFFTGLTLVLNSLTSQWTEQSSRADELSLACTRAAGDIEDADSSGAARLEV